MFGNQNNTINIYEQFLQNSQGCNPFRTVRDMPLPSASLRACPELVEGTGSTELIKSRGFPFYKHVARTGLNLMPMGTPIPEPTTMVLLGFGLLVLIGLGRRKLKK